MLDWIRLREGLADARRTKGLEVAQLADAVRVAPTTIYRIENVKDNPEHKPELDTIDAWLTATNGPKLSAFLARYERELPNVVLYPNDAPANNPPSRPVPTPDEADHHGADLSASHAATDALDALITAIHLLTVDLVAATTAARARADRDRSLSGPGAIEPPRRPDLDHVG